MQSKNKSLKEKFKSFFSKKEEVKIEKRGFEAAKISRLTSDWRVAEDYIDNTIYNDIKRIRGLSRDLSLNNDYYKRYLSLHVNNVVGPNGFKLKVTGYDYYYENNILKYNLDTVGNQLIEEHFNTWGKEKLCEVTKKYSFNDLCRVIDESLVRDGEVLIREIKNKSVNKYGYSLQILRIDRLDELFNKDLPNGNYIKMGIEFNSYGKIIAYHIRKKTSSDSKVTSVLQLSDYERIEASEIIHLFKIKFPEQTRGFPHGHTAMVSLKMLGSLTESALVSARVGAAKMGFFKQTKNSNGVETLADSEENGELFTEVSPGEFGVLPDGWEFESFNPDYPSQQFEPFFNNILRGVASGLNVNYNLLANNLAEVNYSSIRAGVLDERSFWIEEQNFLIDSLLSRVYKNWLEQALLNEAITYKITNKAIPFSKFEKFKEHNFIGRRWAWVDPLKDIQSSIKAIDYNLKSREQITLEEGVDYEDVLIAINKERELASKYGIDLVVDGKLNSINDLTTQNMINQDQTNNDK